MMVFKFRHGPLDGQKQDRTMLMAGVIVPHPQREYWADYQLADYIFTDETETSGMALYQFMGWRKARKP